MTDELISRALDIAIHRRRMPRSNVAAPGLSMTGGDLVARVTALLNPKQARGLAGRTYSIAAAVAAIALGATLSAVDVVEVQSAPAKQTPVIRFDVSSVTRNTSGEERGGIPSPGGNVFLANNVTFEELVRWAYGVGTYPHLPRTWQSPHRWATIDLTNVSESLLKARFEVRGKAPRQPPEPDSGSLGAFHYMVQTLLAERFTLAVRWEQGERTTYVMTMAPADPQPDASLRDVVDGCIVPVKASPSRATATAPTPGDARCTIAWLTGQGGTSARNATMAGIAESLAMPLGAEVIDRTGRKDLFDVQLRWTRPDPSLLIEALRRQFGLRLEPQTAPGEVLRVLSAAMPAD